jgi:hypothetical protein
MFEEKYYLGQYLRAICSIEKRIHVVQNLLKKVSLHK